MAPIALTNARVTEINRQLKLNKALFHLLHIKQYEQLKNQNNESSHAINGFGVNRNES